MHFRRPGPLALASVSLLLAGCASAPPYTSSYSELPTTGTRISVDRAITFYRWGATCRIGVEKTGLTVSRDQVTTRIDGYIPPDGLMIRWPHDKSDEIEIDRGTGTPLVWDDDEIEVSDRWHDLGGDETPLRWDAPFARITGELGPHANFVFGSVWMTTDASDVDLQLGLDSRVIEGALAGNSVKFVIEDPELPQVRLTLGDGREVLWVGAELWIDGELQPSGR